MRKLVLATTLWPFSVHVNIHLISAWPLNWRLVGKLSTNVEYFFIAKTPQNNQHMEIFLANIFFRIHSHCVNVHAITIAVKKSTFFISSTGKTNMNNFLTAKKHSALIRNAKDTVHEQPLTWAVKSCSSDNKHLRKKNLFPSPFLSLSIFFFNEIHPSKFFANRFYEFILSLGTFLR